MKAVGSIQTISGKSLGTINSENPGRVHAELDSGLLQLIDITRAEKAA